MRADTCYYLHERFSVLKKVELPLDSSPGNKVQRRGMKRLAAVFSVVVSLLFSLSPVQAQGVIYAATGSGGIGGELYVVDIATETQTLIGDITNANGGGAIGITGLAFNPMTDTLYGVTVNSTTGGNTVVRSLVTIDPLTAVATVIGSLGSAPLGDIAFRADGTLFGFQGQNPFDLVTINLSTGAVTPVGDSGIAATDNPQGGGLEFSSSGALFLSIHGADGSLDTVNAANGAVTIGPTMSGADYEQPGTWAAFTLDNQGIMYGANSGPFANGISGPVSVSLATINLVNGAVTALFPLPESTDAIAWHLTPVPEASTTAMLALGGAGGIALAAYRRRAKRS